MKFGTADLPENEKLIVWEERFAMDIPSIDDEHKMLVDLCNSLYKAVMSGENSMRKYFVRLSLRTCAGYVWTHFAHEEKLLKLCNYKDFESHKAEHTAFAKKVLDKCSNFKNENFHYSMEFVMFLRDWFFSHIAHTDQLFADDLKAYLKNNNAPDLFTPPLQNDAAV